MEDIVFTILGGTLGLGVLIAMLIGIAFGLRWALDEWRRLWPVMTMEPVPLPRGPWECLHNCPAYTEGNLLIAQVNGRTYAMPMPVDVAPGDAVTISIEWQKQERLP